MAKAVKLDWNAGCSWGIGDQRILSLLHRILQLMFGGLWLFFYLDVEPLSNYSTVTLHLVSPATRILNENPGNGNATAAFDNLGAYHFINNDNFVMISISSEIPLKKLTLLEWGNSVFLKFSFSFRITWMAIKWCCGYLTTLVTSPRWTWRVSWRWHGETASWSTVSGWW